MQRSLIFIIFSFFFHYSGFSQCSFDNATASLCSGSVLNYVPPGGASYLFSWSSPVISPSGAISGATQQPAPQSSLTQTLTNTGTQPATATYTVGVSGPGCTGSPTFIVVVTVNPTPTVSTLSPQEVCPGETTTAITFSGAVPGTTFSLWGNTVPEIGLSASGSGTILPFEVSNPFNSQVTANINILPLANGCSGAYTLVTSITVKPKPTVSQEAVQSVCEGASTALLAFNSSLIGTTFTWTSSVPSIGTGPSGNGNSIPPFVTNNPGSSIITGIITVIPTYDGCAGDPTVVSEISVRPTPIVSTLPAQNICNGGQTLAIVFAGPVANTTFSNWSNSEPAIGIGGSGNGNINPFSGFNFTGSPITGNISITPTANGCPGVLTQVTSITVRPSPVADPLLNINFCQGESVVIPDFSGNIPNAVFGWTNNNTTIGLQASGTGNITPFIGLNTGTSQNVSAIQLAAVEPGNGCTPGNPVNFFIIINPLPVISIVPSSVSLCSGTLVQNVILSAGTPGAEYHWINDNPEIIDLPDTGSFQTMPSFEVNNSTNGEISATIQFAASAAGCTGIFQPLSLIVLPEPFISDLFPLSFCNGEGVPQIPFVSNLAGTEFNWTNSNLGIGLPTAGSTDFLPAFIAQNNSDTTLVGQLTINTVAPNGCSSNIVGSLVVLPDGASPDANFSFTLFGEQYTFSIDNSLGIDSVIWSFGDGNSGSGTSVMHSYDQNDDYTVSVIAVNSCGVADTATAIVNVNVGFELINNGIQLSLSPNPANASVLLRLAEPALADFNLTLLDVSGRTLFTAIIKKGLKEKIIDLSAFPAGHYLISMTSSKQFISRQLIKY